MLQSRHTNNPHTDKCNCVLQDIQVRVTVSLQDNKADYNMMHI